MSTALLVAIIGAVVSAAMGIGTTVYNNHQQKLNAEAADKRSLENSKALMDYQNQLQQSTNTISTQKGFMADAGLNTALMYGGASPAGLYDSSSGSGQGSLANLDNLKNRLAPSDVGNMYLQDQQSKLLARQVSNQERVGESTFIKQMSEAAENFRNTKFQKSMERVIYDRGMAELDLLKSQKAGVDINNVRSSLLLPGELENQGLINEQIATQIKDTTERIKNYPVERAKMRADMNYINSQIERNNKLNELTDEQVRETQERIKGTAVERIMQQYGLVNRSLPAYLRKDQIEDYYLRQPQLLGAVAQLTALGFSQDEAVQTCLWYTASNSKDVSPSLVNAVSRGISALILKK